jgi:hypothetical protein
MMLFILVSRGNPKGYLSRGDEHDEAALSKCNLPDGAKGLTTMPAGLRRNISFTNLS